MKYITKPSDGDWIIEGFEEKIYLCKPDVFAMTYEPFLKADAQNSAVKVMVTSTK